MKDFRLGLRTSRLQYVDGKKSNNLTADSLQITQLFTTILHDLTLDCDENGREQDTDE